MNQFNHIYTVIEKLLNNNEISNYKIKKILAFLWGISELRNGKRKVKNLTLETAEKLYNYQVELEQSDEK